MATLVTNGGSAANDAARLRFGEPVVHAGGQPDGEGERVGAGALGVERVVQ
jgi:hypothetical protein